MTDIINQIKIQFNMTTTRRHIDISSIHTEQKNCIKTLYRRNNQETESFSDRLNKFFQLTDNILVRH